MQPLVFRHRRLALAALVLLAGSACQRVAVQPATSPTGLPGEWRLRATGGGITGGMRSVPAGQEVVLRFSADGTYSQQCATQPQPSASGTYQLRREALSPGQPDTTLVLRLTGTGAAGSPQNELFYVTRLNATDLHYTTGGGCALTSQYGRTSVLLCGNP